MARWAGGVRWQVGQVGRWVGWQVASGEVFRWWQVVAGGTSPSAAATSFLAAATSLASLANLRWVGDGMKNVPLG